MIQIERFVEVPNTGIQEPVLASQFADELCLSISEDYGYAEVVWYALNGTRVVEGSYGYGVISRHSVYRVYARA